MSLFFESDLKCLQYYSCLITILCIFLRFEIEIEPIFGTLALYDVKEKKKVHIFLSY